jgi:hypothetical protein
MLGLLPAVPRRNPLRPREALPGDNVTMRTPHGEIEVTVRDGLFGCRNGRDSP